MSQEFDQDKPGEIVSPMSGEVMESQVTAISRAEIDGQIATAKQYPRNVPKNLKTAETMATLDEDIAASMFYSIPRAGKMLQGASVRLAEIFASTWGNLRIQTRIIETANNAVVVQSVCHDLENNIAVSIEKRRRVLAKRGASATEDDINLAVNSGSAIAFRDAIFKVVPRVYIDRLWKRCQAVSVGKAETFKEIRDKTMSAFGGKGITPERIFNAVGVNGIEDLTKEHVGILRGMWTALNDGTSVDDLFPEPEKKPVNGKPESKNDKPKQENNTEEKNSESKPAPEQTGEKKEEMPEHFRPLFDKIDKAKTAPELNEPFKDWVKNHKLRKSDHSSRLLEECVLRRCSLIKGEAALATIRASVEDAKLEQDLHEKMMAIIDKREAEIVAK